MGNEKGNKEKSNNFFVKAIEAYFTLDLFNMGVALDSPPSPHLVCAMIRYNLKKEKEPCSHGVYSQVRFQPLKIL